MYLPASLPDPVELVDPSRADGFATVAQVLGERSRVALSYAPSTTAINTVARCAASGPVSQAPAQSSPQRPRYTRVGAIAFSGITLMGAAVLGELVAALLRVPMLVPVLGGVVAVVGMLTAISGFAFDGCERGHHV